MVARGKNGLVYIDKIDDPRGALARRGSHGAAYRLEDTTGPLDRRAEKKGGDIRYVDTFAHKLRRGNKDFDLSRVQVFHHALAVDVTHIPGEHHGRVAPGEQHTLKFVTVAFAITQDKAYALILDLFYDVVDDEAISDKTFRKVRKSFRIFLYHIDITTVFGINGDVFNGHYGPVLE